MSGALSLASLIAAMDRDALARLVQHRRVLTPNTVNDPLGLALELLRIDSVNRALQSSHRFALHGLVSLASQHSIDEGVAAYLKDRGLVGVHAKSREIVALSEVTEALQAFDTDFSADEFEAHPEVVDTSVWYGAALTSVRRAAQLIRTLGRRSAKLGRKGVPTALVLRELAEIVHTDADTVGRLIEVMRAADVITSEVLSDGAEHLVTSHAGAAWLEQGYAERWSALAAAATSGLDARMRFGLGQYHDNLGTVVERLQSDYPLLPEAERESLMRNAAAIEDLGVTVMGQLTPAAVALLAGDSAAALSIAEETIPAPVKGVYLQPDLTLIAPGPLMPTDEAALSVFADTEQLGPAASLRLSANSLSRALRLGFTVAQIREVLQRLSLTGIPQPLDFLLNDLERRAISQVATSHATDGFSEHGLTPATQVAAQPAQPAIDAVNEPALTAQARSKRDEELAAMVDRVHDAAQSDDDAAGMMRQIELAIRDRSSLKVTAVAGSDKREFLLLPVSLRGGRLRATDEQAGVERTIPVSAISMIELA